MTVTPTRAQRVEAERGNRGARGIRSQLSRTHIPFYLDSMQRQSKQLPTSDYWTRTGLKGVDTALYWNHGSLAGMCGIIDTV